MKYFTCFICISTLLLSCGRKTNSESIPQMSNDLKYAFKATYSSEIKSPSHPEYAQMVLTVWKMFEMKQIDSLENYYADTVTYDGADGSHYFGSREGLLNIARQDVQNLDSLRFDISVWESLHLNDRNEDWVYVWAKERRYQNNGHTDTSLIHEQWKIVNNKVSYFNQYKAKLLKN